MPRREELKELTLETVAGGAAPELFDQLLDQVLENIEDPNYPAEKQRKLTLEFVFEPGADRHEASVEIRPKLKLADREGVAGRAFIGRQDGELVAVAHDPWQEDMFEDTEPDDEEDDKVVPMEDRHREAEGGGE